MSKTPTSIRIPEPLRAQIRTQAAAERRSISNQICVLLEAALKLPPRERAFVEEFVQVFPDVREIDP